MFPGIFEWVWDPGHLIFFGIFWLVVAVLLSGIAVVLGRTLAGLKQETGELDSDRIENRSGARIETQSR